MGLITLGFIDDGIILLGFGAGTNLLVEEERQQPYIFKFGNGKSKDQHVLTVLVRLLSINSVRLMEKVIGQTSVMNEHVERKKLNACLQSSKQRANKVIVSSIKAVKNERRQIDITVTRVKMHGNH